MRETLMLIVAVAIYFGIVALLVEDAWDQIKRHKRWR